MSKRQALIVILVFLPVAMWIAGVIDRLFVQREIVGEASVGSIGLARGHIVYTLDSARWTRFDISTARGRLKIVANGVCRRTSELIASKDIHYAIEYRLVGGGGEVLAEKVWHFRSDVRHVREEGAETPMLSSFFLDREIMPTAARTSVLDLMGHDDDAVEIHLRMHSADEGVLEVACRLFREEFLTETQRAVRWERMSKAARERLARSSVYSLELLTEEERDVLVGKQWGAVAPSGVKDDDYRTRRLYTVSSNRLREAVEGILPRGLLVERGLVAVIEIPEEGAMVDLTVMPVRAPGPRDRSIVVDWTLHARRASDTLQSSWSVPAGGGSVEERLPGGKLELSCDRAIVVRCELIGPQGVVEVDPRPERFRGIVLADGSSARWRLRGSQAETPVLRVGFRALLESGAESATARVGWATFDGQGVVRDQGELDLEGSVSRFDHAAGGSERLPICDPIHKYFLGDDEAEEIELWALSGRVVVSASTTLDPWERVVRVPEDAYGDDEAGDQRRSWLGVRPLNRSELLADGRSILVMTQPRPPNRSVELVAGDFEMRDVRPRGSWSGRYVLVPVEDRYDDTRESAALLRRVLDGKSARVEARVLETSSSAGHRVVWERRDGGEGPCDLIWTTALGERMERRVYGRCGEARLPDLQPGWTTLSVEASAPVRVWMSAVWWRGAPTARRRFAVGSSAGSSTFRYHKRTAEAVHLIGQVFLAEGEDERTTVCARVRGGVGWPGVLDGWTFRSRRFDLRADEPADVVVIGTGERVRRARRISIPLHADLQPGHYEIEITAGAGEVPFVVLSEVLVGETPGPALRFEPADQAEIESVR